MNRTFLKVWKSSNCKMAEKTPQELRYWQVLNSPGLELKGFYSPTPIDLFQKAATYPDFFNYNLLSPHRMIKCLLNDPHSNIRVFYFNLFRLSYYLESETGMNKTFLHNLRNYVLHPQFQILFTIDSQPTRQIYNDRQFKKLFAEFLYLLDQQDNPDIEHILNCFPIMDAVMIHILRSVLATEGHSEEFNTKIPTDTVLCQLAGLFGLTLTTYGNCWKFEDSDMFCLEHTEQELYIAYVEEVAGEDEGDIPLESDKLISKDAVSIDNSKEGGGVANAIVQQHLATQSLPYSSTSGYIGQEIHIQPLSGQTSSVPLITVTESNSASTPYSLSSHQITDTHHLSKFSKPNNEIVIIDPTPPLSEHEVSSFKLLKELQIPDSNIRNGDHTPVESAVSLVSEVYEFVDFTNTKTIYKDHVPRNKLSANKTAEKLTTNQPKEYHMEDLPQGNLFEVKKSDKASPIYESVSLNTYGTISKNYDSPMYNTTKFSSSPIYQSAPVPEVSKYSAPPYEFSKFQLPKYQPPSFELPHYPSPFSPSNYNAPVSYQSCFKSAPTPNKTSASYGTSNYSGNPTYNPSYNPTYNPSPNSENIPVYQPPMTVSITASTDPRDLGDYYKDFTNSFMLEKMDEPFKTNIRAIKNRMRGVKRLAVTPNTFIVSQPPSRQRTSIAQPVYPGPSNRFY